MDRAISFPELVYQTITEEHQSEDEASEATKSEVCRTQSAPTMANSNQKHGVLIVFESDGSEWATHFAEILRSDPYKIPCSTEHLWNLKEKTVMQHPVHLLLLTPIMATQINNEKLSLLDYKSDTSLLLECNVDAKGIRMHEWTITKKLDRSEETQRHILSTLVEMYERATGDQDDLNPDEFIYIDIVPTVLYPGDRTIHILFSTEPQSNVTVRLEGVQGRLPTKKYTKSTYTCELPEINEAGQRITSVYVEGLSYSLYTTKLVIVTAESLLENFLENFEKTLEIRENPTKLKTWHVMGLFFNPFSEYLCSKQCQLNFYEKLRDMVKIVDMNPIRDSGISTSSEDNYYEMIPSSEEQKVLLRTEGTLRNSVRHQDPDTKKSAGLVSRFKKIFIGNKNNRRENNNKHRYASSKRAAMARSHTPLSVPDLPPRQSTHPIYLPNQHYQAQKYNSQPSLRMYNDF